MSELDKLIHDEIEQSELTREDPISGPRGSLSGAAAVYSVRLSPETKDELERLSKDLDVPASALVRGFVLDGLLGRRKDTVRGLVDKLDTDLQRLRGLL